MNGRRSSSRSSCRRAFGTTRRTRSPASRPATPRPVRSRPSENVSDTLPKEFEPASGREVRSRELRPRHREVVKKYFQRSSEEGEKGRSGEGEKIRPIEGGRPALAVWSLVIKSLVNFLVNWANPSFETTQLRIDPVVESAEEIVRRVREELPEHQGLGECRPRGCAGGPRSAADFPKTEKALGPASSARDLSGGDALAVRRVDLLAVSAR